MRTLKSYHHITFALLIVTIMTVTISCHGNKKNDSKLNEDRTNLSLLSKQFPTTKEKNQSFMLQSDELSIFADGQFLTIQYDTGKANANSQIPYAWADWNRYAEIDEVAPVPAGHIRLFVRRYVSEGKQKTKGELTMGGQLGQFPLWRTKSVKYWSAFFLGSNWTFLGTFDNKGFKLVDFDVTRESTDVYSLDLNAVPQSMNYVTM